MNWNAIEGLDNVESPALLIIPDHVQRNIDRMIQVVGGPECVERLYPHVKTHKMPAVTKMQIDSGITKFKAATLSEAEMAAGVGAPEVLIAHQLVGPKIDRLKRAMENYPATRFAVIADDASILNAFNTSCGDPESPLDVYIDIDCGMHRTGVALGSASDSLRDLIESRDGLRYAGLHVYDGHLHDPDLGQRTEKALAIIRQVDEAEQTRPSPRVIAGGSPTFAIWAKNTKYHCSPGTTLLWDRGYGGAHPEMEFDVAAALLARVISKPQPGHVCLDLGHKSVAAEMPLDIRVGFPTLPDAKLVGQNEEHLVVQTSSADKMPVGQIVLAVPKHICPTVALHSRAHVIRDGRVTGEQWEITARNR
ncbi:MAG: D-TA family PLP-dependent enzyme [Pirellulaceae bacterium]